MGKLTSPLGITVQSVDEILAPYVKRSFEYHYDKIRHLAKRVSKGGRIDYAEVRKQAMEETQRELEQGIQAMEIAYNTLPSSRGDFVFVTYTFGLQEDKWGKMVSQTIMDVRRGGQGADGKKVPVLFPKLVFLFDHEKHGKGKPSRDLFESAV